MAFVPLSSTSPRLLDAVTSCSREMSDVGPSLRPHVIHLRSTHGNLATLGPSSQPPCESTSSSRWHVGEPKDE